MRSYSMSFGVNEALVDFKAKSDIDAKIKAMTKDAEWCVRTKGFSGSCKYTVLDHGWNTTEE